MQRTRGAVKRRVVEKQERNTGVRSQGSASTLWAGPRTAVLRKREKNHFPASIACHDMESMTMKDMWNRIRRARLSAGLSQAALAKETGVRRSAVTQWEKEGGTSPSVANLARIAVVTQVHFEWLATGRGPAGSGRVARGAEPHP